MELLIDLWCQLLYCLNSVQSQTDSLSKVMFFHNSPLSKGNIHSLCAIADHHNNKEESCYCFPRVAKVFIEEMVEYSSEDDFFTEDPSIILEVFTKYDKHAYIIFSLEYFKVPIQFDYIELSILTYYSYIHCRTLKRTKMTVKVHR